MDICFEDVTRILTAILLLGNVEFDTASKNANLDAVTTLLGLCASDVLWRFLTNKTRTSGRCTVKVNCGVSEV